MRENPIGYLCCLVIALCGSVVWYVEMFRDGKVAQLWRRMNGSGQISRNVAAVGAPAMTCISAIGFCIGLLDEANAPGWLMFTLACLMFLLLFTFLVSLLPIRFPRWVYADWQYAKRHGLLDENGNIDQEAYEKHTRRRGFW